MKGTTPGLVIGVLLWSMICARAGEMMDPLEPVDYPGMTVTADAQGVQAIGYTFQNNCLKPSPWQARWIWLNGDSSAPAAMFRHEVVLAGAPQQVKAWLTADTKYQLYVNGRMVSRGPVDIGRDYQGGNTHRWFYDFRDLTLYFKPGTNIIAAAVFREWPNGFVVSRSQPGFLFEAEITSTNWIRTVVKSDAGWRSRPASQFPDATTFDAPKEPAGWRLPGFDDSAWPSSREVTDVWEQLVPSEIPPLMEARYPVARVEGLPGNHVFTNDGAVFTSQPVEYKGAFECSDEGLNQIWKVSRWVVQICLQTHHLDSPNHQEPISDPGDYVIESMVNHDAFAQPWLTRQDVRKFAWLLKDEQYHNFHTSYSIAWLQMLMDYYDHTGDQALVLEMSPYVGELLDTYTSWRGTNGLISQAPNYMFMDWVTIGGFECHHPPAVIGQGYLTAYYYHALDMASRVAGLTGDTGRVRHYAQLRREVKAAFNRELWNPKKGRYRDGKPFQTSIKPHDWLPADQAIETFSPHVNLLAVLYDLAPPNQQRGIVQKVMAEQPLNTQPWFMYWVFAAVDHAGLFDRYAGEQLHRWQIVPATQSFYEMWHGGDLSHGWCAAPLVQMSTRVLGVTPGSPGFDRIAIRPELGDLQWARGVVPTPHGDVKVAWKLKEDGWKMDITIPPGAQAEVVLPASRFRQPRILMDGMKAPARVVIPAGEHYFAINGTLKPVITK